MSNIETLNRTVEQVVEHYNLCYSLSKGQIRNKNYREWVASLSSAERKIESMIFDRLVDTCWNTKVADRKPFDKPPMKIKEKFSNLSGEDLETAIDHIHTQHLLLKMGIR